MKTIEPRVIIACEESISIILKALKLENHTAKIIVLGTENSIFPSFREITKLATEEGVSKFEVVKSIDPQLPGCIFFTSGTTGEPKAVLQTYGSMQKLVLGGDFLEDLQNHKKVVLDYLDPEWDISLVVTMSHILKEITQIFHYAFEPLETFKFIEKYQVSK